MRHASALALFYVSFCLSFVSHAFAIAIYTPSDAYQESILKPIHALSDVAIFHYSVPPQTCKASWTFVAFTDEPTCEEKLVHVHLRFGSYPVISIDNTSFPEDVLLPRDLGEHPLYIETFTHFQPKDMPQLDVRNPLPGSWFAIAYIAEDDKEAITQQGISHTCHYSLGSMASWTQETSFHLLVPGAPMKMHNLTEVTWLKVFVPENSWMLRIKLSNCILILNDNESSIVEMVVDVEECIEQLGAAANALPSLSPLKNLSLDVDNETSAYYYDVVQPEINVYYYIGLMARDNYTFTIDATIEECESLPLRENLHPSALTLTHMTAVVSSETSLDIQKSTKEDEYYSSHTKRLSEEAPKCYPVLPLTRIKHAQDFLDSFLFQGKDWFSSRLKLHDREPVPVRFEILPFVDIGGTLIIKFQFDDIFWANSAPFRYDIDICLSQRAPALPLSEDGDITCPFEQLRMHLTSNETANSAATRLIPFPQPGLWFVTLKSTCSVINETLRGNSSCDSEEVRLDVRVRLQPCILEGDQCGSHGFCKESHFRHFYFSSCHCTDGWKGWACSDGNSSISPYLTLFQTLLLILSNLFFVPAVYIAIKWRFYAEAVVYLATMFFSSFYHACDTENIQICVFKYDVLQFCDFYSAILSFWVTVVAMSNLPLDIASMAHMAGALGIALAVQSEKTGLWTFVVPVVAGIALMLLSWGRQCIHSKSFKFTRKLLNIIPGAALATTGLVLFAFLETEGNYKYVHSGWHVSIALSITFLLPRNETVKLPASANTVSTSPINDSVLQRPASEDVSLQHTTSDHESIDIGDYRLNSDLTSLITN